MTVSLCIVAYNEEKSLPLLLEQIKAQSFDKQNTEIVLVDSASDDGTKNIFRKFAEENIESYFSIQVLDNPKRSQASGWNTAISAALGDVIIRLDAHAEIPEDFIEQNINLINSGESVCGGARPVKIDSPSPKKEMLYLAEASMFGSSPASYRRRSGEKKYVDSVFHAAYKREVFEKIGGFNESLGRTEDNELHYRVRKAGYRICQGGDVVSYQHIRPTLLSMMKQKFGNGEWIGLTMGVCYQCISTFHFVPFLFVLCLFCSLLLLVSAFITGLVWMAYPFILVFGTYFLANIMMSVAAIATYPKKHPLQIFLPAVFFLLHISYGTGTVVGLLKLPFWKHRLKKSDRKSGVSAKQQIENVRQAVIKNSAGKGETNE